MSLSGDGLQHRSRRELKIEAVQAGTPLRCMDAALDMFSLSTFLRTHTTGKIFSLSLAILFCIWLSGNNNYILLWFGFLLLFKHECLTQYTL